MILQSYSIVSKDKLTAEGTSNAICSLPVTTARYGNEWPTLTLSVMQRIGE